MTSEALVKDTVVTEDHGVPNQRGHFGLLGLG